MAHLSKSLSSLAEIEEDDPQNSTGSLVIKDVEMVETTLDELEEESSENSTGTSAIKDVEMVTTSVDRSHPSLTEKISSENFSDTAKALIDTESFEVQNASRGADHQQDLDLGDTVNALTADSSQEISTQKVATKIGNLKRSATHGNLYADKHKEIKRRETPRRAVQSARFESKTEDETKSNRKNNPQWQMSNLMKLMKTQVLSSGRHGQNFSNFASADTSMDGEIDFKEFKNIPMFKTMGRFLGLSMKSIRADICSLLRPFTLSHHLNIRAHTQTLETYILQCLQTLINFSIIPLCRRQTCVSRVFGQTVRKVGQKQGWLHKPCRIQSEYEWN